MPAVRLIAVAAAAAPLAVSAASLVPADGTLVPLSGSSTASQPWMKGTIVEDLYSPYAFTLEVDGFGAGSAEVQMTGRVQSRVIHAADGTYDFYWRVLPDARSPFRGFDSEGQPIRGVMNGGQPITMFSIGSFGRGAYRADWLDDGSKGAAPTVAAGGPGALTFGFGGTLLNPGGDPVQLDYRTAFTNDQSSRFMYVDTDAHGYRRTGTFQVSALEDAWYGGFSTPATTFAPIAAPVPEPSTWALMLAGLGLVLVGGRRWRR